MAADEQPAASMPCTRCGATPETGQGEDCPECQGIVGPINDGLPLSQRRTPSAARSRPLRPFRRLHGLCLYCGRPVAGDVCRYCSDLPLRDPLVSKARLPLSEAERITARG